MSAVDPRFQKALDDILNIHRRKSADYGRTNDPFANVRASEEWGIPGWVGTLIRANDKVRRLQAAAQGSDLENEGVEDSLIDLATYAIIALVLYREQEDTPVVPDQMLDGSIIDVARPPRFIYTYPPNNEKGL